METLKNKVKTHIFILIIFLILCFIISFMLGKYPIPPKELFSILLSKIIPIDQIWTNQMEIILFNVRLPRIILAVLVGCCLSAAGVSYQGIFMNPMVSPDILGASQGATFGAALAIILSLRGINISMMAFVFSIVSVILVYIVSKKAKGNQVIGLVLSGIMIGSLFSSGTSFLKLVADPTDQLPAITYWLMGSFSGVEKSDVTFAIIPMLIGLIPLFIIRWKINVLTMGDDEARTMGINTKRVRIIVIICSTLVTASSISVSGMIGWVGLVIPHFSRMLIGCDYKKLLPVSMLMGASFLLIVDNVARLIYTAEIPIGILTSFVGAPFFLYLISREGNKF